MSSPRTIGLISWTLERFYGRYRTRQALPVIPERRCNGLEIIDFRRPQAIRLSDVQRVDLHPNQLMSLPDTEYTNTTPQTRCQL